MKTWRSYVIQKGQLWQLRQQPKALVEILDVKNKRIMDPRYPQSAEIVTTVRAIPLTGPAAGNEFTDTFSNFRLRWQKVGGEA